MMPAWMSKLKAVSKSKQKQSKAPFLPPSHTSLSKSPNPDGCMYFAEPLHLQGGNCKSKPTCLELGSSCSTDTDSIFSSNDNDAPPRMHPCMHPSTGGEAATSNLCRYERMDSFTSNEVPFQSVGCVDFEHNFFALSSCGIKADPHLCEGKERTVSCVQKDLYGPIDNDTEGSIVLTPNTIDSSFGSESSSTDSSSMVRRCGCADKDRQCLVSGQEGDDLSGLGSVESGIETVVYSEETPSFGRWQRNSLLENFQGDGKSYDIGAMSRLSYDEGACSGRKIRPSCAEKVTSSGLEMDTISKQTRSEAKGCLSLHESYSQNMVEDHSVSSVYECHRQVFCTVGSVAAGSTSRMCHVGSLSFAGSSFGSSAMHKEERNSCAPNNLSFVNGHNLLSKRSIIGSMFSGLPCSAWEERSALIAVENPGLMISSKWQESSCSLRNSHSESGANADENCDLSMCEGQCDENRMAVCDRQDDANGLSLCAQGEHGNAGLHKSMYNAYVERGRRQRGSSFSAALPKDLQGVVGDSVALVKMSNNPYEDFRHSMYEMIMDKDLEESMDVEELLYCYLSLNSPEHHELIKEVFSDVWSAILMSVR